MHRSTMTLPSAFLALLALFLWASPANAAFNQAYCTSQNTGDGNGTPWTYQSNGWCTDHCKGSAFAVLLERNCWCTNYAPADNLRSTDECNDDCLGYPTEKCGNKAKGLYLYIKQDGTEPAGTKGASKPTSSVDSPSTSASIPPPAKAPTPPPAPPSSTSAVRTSQAPETIIKTVTGRPEEVALTSSPTAAQTTAPTTLQTSAAPPQTSVNVVTEGGATITRTIVTTPTALPVDSNKGGSSNTGAIVGGAVGGVLGLAAIAAIMVFFLFRRRRLQHAEGQDESGVHRNVSTMSRSGLLRTEKPGSHYPSPITTTIPTYSRQSRNLDQDSISPISASDRRNSRHMVDQRLNPSALFVLDNSSSGSIGTMDDSRDYHRTLNVRNPDP